MIAVLPRIAARNIDSKGHFRFITFLIHFSVNTRYWQNYHIKEPLSNTYVCSHEMNIIATQNWTVIGIVRFNRTNDEFIDVLALFMWNVAFLREKPNSWKFLLKKSLPFGHNHHYDLNCVFRFSKWFHLEIQCTQCIYLPEQLKMFQSNKENTKKKKHCEHKKI